MTNYDKIISELETKQCDMCGNNEVWELQVIVYQGETYQKGKLISKSIADTHDNSILYINCGCGRTIFDRPDIWNI